MATRLERLVAMDDMIRRGRYPDKQILCEMFEVKERTVFEDIRYLKEEMAGKLNSIGLKTAITIKIPINNWRLSSFQMAKCFSLRLEKKCFLNTPAPHSSRYWKALLRKFTDACKIVFTSISMT